jgi:hypothetical protein
MRFCKQTSAQALDDSLKFKDSEGFVFAPIFVPPRPKQNTNIFSNFGLNNLQQEKTKFWKMSNSPTKGIHNWKQSFNKLYYKHIINTLIHSY